MQHVQQRSVVFIKDNHHLLAVLFMAFEDDVAQALTMPVALTLQLELPLDFLQAVADALVNLCNRIAFHGSQAQMNHGILLPFLLQLFYSQSFEQFPVAPEIGGER